jgi:hypothetical protein
MRITCVLCIATPVCNTVSTPDATPAARAGAQTPRVSSLSSLDRAVLVVSA